METVVNTIASAGSVASNTIASASSMATKAIWGDPNKESQNEMPKSGESGDMKAAELVDKGKEGEDPNREGDTPLTDDHLYGKLGVLSGGDPLDKSTEGILEPRSSPSNNESLSPPFSSTPDTNTNTSMADSTSTSLPIRSQIDQSSSNETFGGVSSVAAGASSPMQGSQEQQGADRPSDEPSTTEEYDRIASTEEEAKDTAKVDTGDLEPEPLSEGKAGGNTEIGAEEDNGPEKESQGEGTGEKHVQSSGMNADGGDFDATNPGAGREADRLLEQKGVDQQTLGETDASAKTEAANDTAEEESKGGKLSALKEKIKAKLHKN